MFKRIVANTPLMSYRFPYVYARLEPSHASYRGPELVWATDRSFDVAGPRLWNKLLASADSVCQFRRQLKMFLFVKD